MRGLRIFHSPRIQSWNEHCGSSKVYGDLRKQKYTKNMFQLSKFKEWINQYHPNDLSEIDEWSKYIQPCEPNEAIVQRYTLGTKYQRFYNR